MAGKGRPGPECVIAGLLSSLPEGEEEVLTMALTDRDEAGRPTYSSRIVAEAATEIADRNGIDASPSSFGVRYHRRRECRCE